eukprot:scaffold38769_cov35-Tisochrysis_lutea.AAC.6
MQVVLSRSEGSLGHGIFLLGFLWGEMRACVPHSKINIAHPREWDWAIANAHRAWCMVNANGLLGMRYRAAL